MDEAANYSTNGSLQTALKDEFDIYDTVRIVRPKTSTWNHEAKELEIEEEDNELVQSPYALCDDPSDGDNVRCTVQ